MNEKPKILIADDSEINRALLKEILGDGYDYLEAEDGAAAVELMRQRTDISLLLLDLMMPGMDGYEATRAIRLSEKADAADIPIIALTANAFAEDAQAAHDAGMNAHLPKPLDFNKLKNMLARIKKYGSVSL